LTGSTVTKYYFAGATRIAMRKYTIPQSMTVEYLLGDHLGSTSITTNANGTKVSELRYKPWGETRYMGGSTQTSYRYTGQFSYESDFGLYFYQSRFYDPSIGRFSSPDTIVPTYKEGEVNPYLVVSYSENIFLDQLNQHNAKVLAKFRGKDALSIEQMNVDIQGFDRFSYTKNNPIKFTDATGHCADPVSGTLCLSLIPAGPVGWILIGGLVILDVALIVNLVNTWDAPTTVITTEDSVPDLATQMRGEYIPPGLKGTERDAYREALHRYKDAYGLGARDNVPKDILDKIGDLVKRGVKPSDVINWTFANC
jgi:RHS repeat-associated protein